MRKGAAAWIALALAFAGPAFGAPEIKEYPVPNGSHPRDVAAALDGGVRQILGRKGEVWLSESGSQPISPLPPNFLRSYPLHTALPQKLPLGSKLQVFT